MKHILVLEHDPEDPIGYLGEIMRERGIAYDVVQVNSLSYPQATQYDAIIILGGAQHLYDDIAAPYLIQEKAFLQQAIAHNIPQLGICLGGQLLAYALDAPVKRHTLKEIGFFDVQLTEAGQTDPLYRGIPGYQKVFHWHEDTFDLPEGAVLLATSTTTRNQAFRYGQWIYGLQYHIELDPQLRNQWLTHPALKKGIIDTQGIDAYNALMRDQELQYPIFLEHARILFENFLRIGGIL